MTTTYALPFTLGQTVATPGAIEAMGRNRTPSRDLLRSHLRLEQGDLCDSDHKLNQRAVKEGFRVFSSFKLSDETRVWVITEADRSYTTILLPEEY